MTSNGEQGVAFFSDGAQGFLTGVSTSVSDHMDQRPRMNNVCRALAQTSVSTANTLHPSVLAARLSFTLCSRPTPSKHITEAEITFGDMILQPLPCNIRPHHACRVHTQTHHCGFTLQHHSQLSFSGHFHHSVYHPPQSWRNPDCAPARQPIRSQQQPLQTSLFWVEVSLNCFEHLLSIFFPFSVSHSLLLLFLLESTQRLAYM